MSIVVNGSGTITGISTGGLPDNTVDSDTIVNNTIVATDIKNETKVIKMV